MLLRSLLAWKQNNRVRGEIAVSIFVGICIEIFILAFQPPALTVVRRVADETADKLIRLAEQITSRIDHSPAFVFIDIDDATWLKWNKPLVTPRDKLRDLIQRAAQSAPLAIIVDVDLAFRDASDSEPNREALLRDYLAAYPASAPLLILNRALSSNQGGKGLRSPRPTLYDEATKSHDNIVWAAPLFLRSADGVIRRWELFAPFCNADKKEDIVPSTHLKAALAARQNKPWPAGAAKSAGRLLQQKAIPPEDCNGTGKPRQGVIDDTPGYPDIEINHKDVSTRVLYRVAWKEGALSLGPRVDGPGGADAPLVLVRPAQDVLLASASAPLPGFANRIVIIGGSFADSGDWHQTSLGRMPGALLLINAIEALTINGTPREVDRPWQILISLLIIVVAACLAAWYRPVVAAGLLTLCIFILLIASVVTFQSGVLVDLAAPAVGAAVHDFGEASAKFVRQVRELGWRGWIRKPETAAAEPPKPETAQTATAEKAPSGQEQLP